jgi:hypothetical protein
MIAKDGNGIFPKLESETLANLGARFRMSFSSWSPANFKFPPICAYSTKSFEQSSWKAEIFAA